MAHYRITYYNNVIHNLTFDVIHEETTEQRTYKQAQKHSLEDGLINAMQKIGDDKTKLIISIEIKHYEQRYIYSMLRRDSEWIRCR